MADATPEGYRSDLWRSSPKGSASVIFRYQDACFNRNHILIFILIYQSY
ncbi:hypothetical protein HW132_26495 [Brasilonema sp. CT11]|nr:hypothetical protein [Brasilonema sp. CT11]